MYCEFNGEKVTLENGKHLDYIDAKTYVVGGVQIIEANGYYGIIDKETKYPIMLDEQYANTKGYKKLTKLVDKNTNEIIGYEYKNIKFYK